MRRFAWATFLGAFLLFGLQPLEGKYILPWFGGTPSVWTTCLLFFQLVLLLGYAYAHLIVGRLARVRQAQLHLLLVAASLAFIPIIPGDAWRPTGQEPPTAYILWLLGATVGLPYLLLSSTGPLVQSWFVASDPGHSPYRLYALSNLGSLAALVAYPVLVEPNLPAPAQAAAWSILYVLFAALLGWCAWGMVERTRHRAAAQPNGPAAKTPPHLMALPIDAGRMSAPRRADQLRWLALAAAGSIMLSATTNQMCQEVAVTPLLWVLPLAIYLVSFIVAFDNDRWQAPRLQKALLLGIAPIACLTFALSASMDLWLQIGIDCLTLLIATVAVHCQLAQSKPNSRYLTQYYLLISAGGALGGALVAIVAPAVFEGYWEYPLGLALCCALVVTAPRNSTVAAPAVPRPRLAWGVSLAMLTLLAAALGMKFEHFDRGTIAATRNFFGVLRVADRDRGTPHARRLFLHGQTIHGQQFLDPQRKHWATTYFGPHSGIGITLVNHPARQQGGLRVGVIGLGCGTLAAYAQPGDHFCFYEINPQVEELAREHFTYLNEAQAPVEVVIGDARIQLERHPRPESELLDLLIMDAFSSDAVPMHLLTREAMAIYLQHLKPDGILAANVSNRNLDLLPVVRGLARDAGREIVYISNRGDDALGVDAADWVLMTNNRAFLEAEVVNKARTPWPAYTREPLVWTDEYGSLWHLVLP